MVLVSVKSVETNNGYDYQMDLPEALVIDPNSSVSLVSFYYERQNGVLLDSDNNYMYVRVGGASAPLHLLNLGISNASIDTTTQDRFLSPSELANRIQDSFNNKFGPSGYTINVFYDPTTNLFSIETHYRNNEISVTFASKLTITQGVEYGAYTATTGSLVATGLTAGTANYAVTDDYFETTNVPTKAQNGAKLSAQFEVAPTGVTAGDFGNGVVVGLIKTQEVPNLVGNAVKPVSSPANCQQIFAGICVYERATGANFLDIIEKGVSVMTAPVPITIGANEKLQVILVSDPAFANSGSIIYQVVDSDGGVKKIKPDNSTMTKADWEHVQMQMLVGTDTPTITNFKDISGGWVGQSTGIGKTPIDFNVGSLSNGPSSLKMNDWISGGVDFIVRDTYDADSQKDNDSGVVSPLILPNVNSTMAFSLGSAFFGPSPRLPQDVYFGICDETQRLINITLGSTLGTDSSNGLNTDGGGGAPATAYRNPMYVNFRVTGAGLLEVRDNQNTDTAVWTTLQNIVTWTGFRAEIRVSAVSNSCSLFYKQKLSDNWTQSPPFSLPRMNATELPNFIANYSLTSGAGYRFHFNIRRWTSSTSTTDWSRNPTIGNLGLHIQDDDTTASNFIEMIIDDDENDGLGSLIGFLKGDYQFTATANSHKAERQFDVSYREENPERCIYVNCNNLGLRNLIGQKYSTTNSLASGPQGNLQGVNRYVAKVPRYHDDNGDSVKGNQGPFYYDYFPYGVQLKNATELVLNDFHITLTDDNNAFATDVKYSEVLLSISKVESMGQGDNPTIGRSRELHQTKSQRNVLQSQMPPSIN